MRVVELSNHPGAMLQEARQRRPPGGPRPQSPAGVAQAQHRARLAEAGSRRDRARAGRHWWTWLRCALAVRRERRQAPAAAAAVNADRVERLRAGVAGEQAAEAALARVFGHGWTLLRGYRNRAGEIDQLLLGGRGLIAIEVKYLNATVHCDGDDWRADKYDKYGNLVDRHPIADGGGRSPSRQLNDPADLLEQFLHAHGQPVPIQRVVLLTHSRSRVGPLP